jgi:uncharacterized protein YjbI with pentapeptide repeats
MPEEAGRSLTAEDSFERLHEVNVGVGDLTFSATDLLQRYAGGERNFGRAVLAGASLDGAELRDVDLEDASLTGCQRPM